MGWTQSTMSWAQEAFYLFFFMFFIFFKIFFFVLKTAITHHLNKTTVDDRFWAQTGPDGAVVRAHVGNKAGIPHVCVGFWWLVKVNIGVGATGLFILCFFFFVSVQLWCRLWTTTRVRWHRWCPVSITQVGVGPSIAFVAPNPDISREFWANNSSLIKRLLISS